MHIDRPIFQQRHTPQGNFTNLLPDAANLPTETGLPHPLVLGLIESAAEILIYHILFFLSVLLLNS